MARTLISAYPVLPALAALVLILFAERACASMTVDLRATGTSSGTVVDAKTVNFSGGVGDVVIMDVVATVSGTGNNDPLDDYIVFLHGSFLSTTNGLAGDLKAKLTPDFIWLFSSNGLQQDLDGDSDLDVGSNNADIPANFFRADISDSAPYVAQAKIATLTWTRSAGGSDETFVNFRPRVRHDAGLWWIDGIGYYADQDEFGAGAPVTIKMVPEPIGVQLLVVFGLFRWWRVRRIL